MRYNEACASSLVHSFNELATTRHKYVWGGVIYGQVEAESFQQSVLVCHQLFGFLVIRFGPRKKFECSMRNLHKYINTFYLLRHPKRMLYVHLLYGTFGAMVTIFFSISFYCNG